MLHQLKVDIMNKSKTLRWETPEDIQRAYEEDPRSMKILMGFDPDKPIPPMPKEISDFLDSLQNM